VVPRACSGGPSLDFLRLKLVDLISITGIIQRYQAGFTAVKSRDRYNELKFNRKLATDPSPASPAHIPLFLQNFRNSLRCRSASIATAVPGAL
jgi:hypothetical protein